MSAASPLAGRGKASLPIGRGRASRVVLADKLPAKAWSFPKEEGGKLSQWVAVEPVTHISNGINLHAQGWKGTGVRVLEPGERWTASWALSVGDI